MLYFYFPACAIGIYGQDCSFTCGNCAGGEPCYHVDGICPSGCEPGWVIGLCSEGKSHVFIIIFNSFCKNEYTKLI